MRASANLRAREKAHERKVRGFRTWLGARKAPEAGEREAEAALPAAPPPAEKAAERKRRQTEHPP